MSVRDTVVSLLASAWLAAFALANRLCPAFLARWIDLASSTLLSVARLNAGGTVTQLPARRPGKHSIVLYEYEACPFCRRVREALSALDLDYTVRPCPRVTFSSYGVLDGSRFRPAAKEAGGRAMFPLLVDSANDKVLYESGDIVKYLFETYGGLASHDVEAKLPLAQRRLKGPVEVLPVVLRCRAVNGALRMPSRAPPRRLRLTAYEAEPRWRIVREALCCLELEYEMTTCARGTAKANLSCGLSDPNTGRDFGAGDWAAAAEYLFAEYSTGDFPNESMLANYTTKGASSGTYGTVPGAKKDE